jgi:predicted PurR-regulated permease PerM
MTESREPAVTESPEKATLARSSDDEERPLPIPFPVRVDVRSVALTGLFILAVFYSLYVGRSFFVPVVLALLLSFVFSPLVRRLKRARVPESVSATVILVALVGAVSYSAYALSGPASDWLARAPESLKSVESKLRKLRRPVEQVSKAAEQVEKAAAGGAADAVKVEIQDQTLASTLFGGTQAFLGNALVVAILFFFLLASGDLFLAKVIKVIPRLEDKKRAVQIARETEDQISSYLGTTTIINVTFGAVVAVAMWWLEMPNPALWGVVAGLTNFVPYLGGLVCLLVIGVVALVQFDSVGRALLVSGVFFALNTLEGNLITPLIVGRQLSLNPVVIFVSVLLWGWLWGIPGLLLAIPIMAALKIMCDHIEGLGPIGEFLGH